MFLLVIYTMTAHRWRLWKMSPRPPAWVLVSMSRSIRKTAERYFVTDGQKDIAARFDRRTSRVIAALKYDWEPNDQNLAMAWRNGGTLKISKIYPDPATGKYDYLGTKGQKIEWEMVPMGELFVEEGTLPGTDVLHLSGADGTIWHPSWPLGLNHNPFVWWASHP